MIFINSGVYFEEHSTFVIADLHLGKQVYNENLNIPTVTTNEVSERLHNSISDIGPSHLVIAGDCFHYQNPNEEEIEVINEVRSTVDRLTILVGNHEYKEEYIPDIPGVNVGDEISINGNVVFHGHKTPVTTGDRFILGHLHPYVYVGGRSVRSYLRTTAYGKETIVLPSFTKATGKNPIQKTNPGHICPVLKESEKFEYIRVDESQSQNFKPIPKMNG